MKTLMNIISIICLCVLFTNNLLASDVYSDWLAPYDRHDSNTVAVFHFDEATGISIYGEDNNSTKN